MSGINTSQKQGTGLQHSMNKAFIDSEQDAYNFLLEKAANLSGMSTKDIEYAMEVIAYHEAGKDMDPTQKQSGGGPGRGLFQYELRDWWSADGKRSSGGGRTAVNRLYRELGGDFSNGTEPKYLPGWLAEFAPKVTEGGTNVTDRQPTGEVDVSMLSGQQQKIIFLADKIQDGSIGQLKKKSLAGWWLDHHNKSRGTTTRMKRFASFKRDHIYYDVNETIEDGVSLISKSFNYK